MLVRALKSNTQISVQVSNWAVDKLMVFFSDAALYKQQVFSKNVTVLPPWKKKKSYFSTYNHNVVSLVTNIVLIMLRAAMK